MASRKTTPLWWDQECSRQVALRRRSVSLFSKHKTRDNFIAMQRQIAITARHLRLTKRQAWKNYTASIQANVSQSTLWKRVRWFSRRKGGGSRTYPTNNKWKYQYLKTYTPDWVSPDPQRTPVEQPEYAVPQFTDENIRQALRTKRTYSAPGKDEITYHTINEFSDHIIH